MDETAYRQALSLTVPRSCVFEKAILTGSAACSTSEKRNIAEREVVCCTNAASLEVCNEFRSLLRHSFMFALGSMQIEDPLPHAKQMRIQCGGLRGLQFVIDGNSEVHNIVALLEMAHQKFGDLKQIPYSEVVCLANQLYKPR